MSALRLNSAFSPGRPDKPAAGFSAKNGEKFFEPAWWCPSPHVQTIWRSLFGKEPVPRLRRIRWDTVDGDFIDLDFLNVGPLNHKTPVILLLHGLEGSSRSQYILGLLNQCYQKKWLGIAMNFRTCSGEINRVVRSYHSGETEDLNWVIGRLLNLYPDHPIFIVGYSLGGNVLLKWLGEKGERIPSQIMGAAAISVPFDLKISVAHIDSSGFCHSVYGASLLKTLKAKFLLKIRQFHLNYSDEAIKKITTFGLFDELVTAPVHGFRNADEYWRESSSVRFLDNIRRPVYLLSAMDDPLLPADLFAYDQVKRNSLIKAEITPAGGHLGFVSGDTPWNASYYSDSRIIRFFEQALSKEEKAFTVSSLSTRIPA